MALFSRAEHTDIDSVPIVRVNNIKDGYILTDDLMRVPSANAHKEGHQPRSQLGSLGLRPKLRKEKTQGVLRQPEAHFALRRV